MSSELEQQLVDVKKYLGHHSSNVRLKAVEIVSGCSSDTQLHPFFTKLNIGKQLLQLIADSNKDIAYHSCVSLVNLSSNPNFTLNLLKASPFNTIIKELRSKYISNKVRELLIKMLVNMTQTSDGISDLLQENTSVQGLHIIRLIHILKTIHADNHQQIRMYHYLPYVLCNITQNNVGRELIMEPQRNLIGYIIPFMDYNFDYHLKETNKKTKQEKDDIAIGECYKTFHRGIWNTIRNCIWLLNDEPQQLLKQMEKQKNKKKDEDEKNEDNVDLKKAIHNYYLRIFLDYGNKEEEWTKNALIFEIINPLIGGLHEYEKKLRKKMVKLQKKEKERNETSMDNLLKRMSFDKFRFDDEEIRKIALQCLHLVVGVDAEFDLDVVIPKILNELFIDDLLKEYEIWESSSELIRISKDIRSTLKHQLEKLNKDDKTDENGVEQKEQGNNNEEQKLERKDKDEIVENGVDDDNKDSNNGGMDIQPMAQEFHSVKTVEKKTFNQKESNALFDLVMQHSNNNENDKNDK